MHKDAYHSAGDGIASQALGGLDRPAQHQSSENFSAASTDFWKNTYADIARLGGGSGRSHSGGGDSGQLDFGNSSSIYGGGQGYSHSGRHDHHHHHHHHHGNDHHRDHGHGAKPGGSSPATGDNAINQSVNFSSAFGGVTGMLLDAINQTGDLLPRNNTDAPAANSSDDVQSQIAALTRVMEDFMQAELLLIQQLAQQNDGAAATDVAPPTAPTDTTAGGSDRVSETTGSVANGTYSLEDAIKQNDMNSRGQVVADIPFHGPNTWGDGKSVVDNNVVPPGVTNYAPWGVIAPEQGKVADPNTVIDLKDQHVYFHKKGGGWVEAANPQNSGFWEGNFYNDFHGNLSFANPSETLADGTFQFKAAGEGQVSHFGNGNTPVAFDPGLYDGVFQRVDAKADRNDSNLVIDAAGDYYRDSGKIWGEEGQNESNLRNPGAGTSNWTRLSDQWQTTYFTTMSADQLRNEPPPGMS
ncbi:MAG: hypothetical protein JSS86_05025 [Cyanobacteria bacterium SZAS LIN-2]|nr:hypothetical protein [Cyanobacteria bacterium SZAS LIN-2]